MRMRVALCAVLLTSVLLGFGCSTTVLGPEGETAGVYRLGSLKSNVGADIGATYKAAMQAMDELGLSVTRADQNELEAEIVARSTNDDRYEINFTALSDRATVMTIKVASVEKARRIHQAVMKNLGQL